MSLHKQVFVINSDLDMGKGKIAVQVAHGEVFYLNHMFDVFDNDIYTLSEKRYDKWRNEYNELMKKVVLKASHDEIIDLRLTLSNKNIWSYLVYDRGLTQIPQDSMTCMVVEPFPEEKCDLIFGHLKLL